MSGHPPPPGPIVAPDVSAIENAVRHITFPISKREMIEQLNEEDTIVLGGRNVELRRLVRDIHDDYFESEDEFHDALEVAYGAPSAPLASDQPALPPDNP